MRVLALVVPALLLASGAASAATFTVEVEPGQAPTYDGPEGLAELRNRSDGTRYSWNLSLPDGTTVGTFRLHSVFDVNRTRQIVPTFDDRARHPDADHLHPHFFTEVAGDRLRDGPRRAYNATTNISNRTVRLALPGPGPAVLELVRDVAGPNVTKTSTRDVTHVGFTLVTRTDEPALATLRLAPIGGGQNQSYPTQNPSYRQTFPVQGLDGNTSYRLAATYRDWAGNERVRDLGTVRTAPAPDPPKPRVVPVFPTPNATVGEPVDRIEAEVGNASVPATSARLFVDKLEVYGGLEVADGSLGHRLSEPLGDGLHVVRIEARSGAGAVGVADWSFTVQASSTPAVGVPVVAVSVAVAALAWALRRSPQRS